MHFKEMSIKRMTNVEKARILLTMHYLEIGGAETALIGLMNALDPQRVSVDLFLHDHRGEMMRFVPGWVNVLPPVRGYAMLERPMREVVRRGNTPEDVSFAVQPRVR